MTSTIRFYSFKDLPWSKKQPGILILVLLILGAVIWLYSEVALLLIASTYAAAGVILHLVRFIRHRTPPRAVPS
jgi:phosphatidylserine synthase